MTRPRHYLKTDNGDTGIAWCNRFVHLRTGRWTEVFSQVDCYPCIAEVHRYHKARGECAMRDHRSRTGR